MIVFDSSHMQMSFYKKFYFLISIFYKLIKIRAGVNLKYGLTKFFKWYYEYYKVKI